MKLIQYPQYNTPPIDLQLSVTVIAGERISVIGLFSLLPLVLFVFNLSNLWWQVTCHSKQYFNQLFETVLVSLMVLLISLAVMYTEMTQ